MITIIGKHNIPSASIKGHWELDESLYKFNQNIEVGDYAIVENYNDYSLVKIIGICETKDNYVPHLTDKHKLKKVVKVIPREEIRED